VFAHIPIDDNGITNIKGIYSTCHDKLYEEKFKTSRDSLAERGGVRREDLDDDGRAGFPFRPPPPSLLLRPPPRKLHQEIASRDCLFYLPMKKEINRQYQANLTNCVTVYEELFLLSSSALTT